MSKNKITQVYILSPEELNEQTSSIIEKAFQKHAPKFQPKPEVKYLTRKDVAAIFKISLVTVNEWSKLGIINPYRLGRLVRFKSSEIDEALIRINNKSID
jgi:excisionase family DNA binding protein